MCKSQEKVRVCRVLGLISVSLVLACGQPEDANEAQPPDVVGQQLTASAPMPKWSPSFGDAPLGYVDATPPSIPQGINLGFSGWAGDARDGAPVKSITVFIDGKPFATASLGFARPAVAATLGRPEMRHCGWVALVDTAKIPVGRHAYSVIAENSRGRREMLRPVGDPSVVITP
jgi:hypothetical protein